MTIPEGGGITPTGGAGDLSPVGGAPKTPKKPLTDLLKKMDAIDESIRAESVDRKLANPGKVAKAMKQCSAKKVPKSPSKASVKGATKMKDGLARASAKTLQAHKMLNSLRKLITTGAGDLLRAMPKITKSKDVTDLPDVPRPKSK